MADQRTYTSSRGFDSFFHQPGDGYRYSIILPDKLQQFKSLPANERGAYILGNFDLKEPVDDSHKKITVKGTDGVKYSITSPEKLETFKGKSSAREKIDYVKNNYDEKDAL